MGLSLFSIVNWLVNPAFQMAMLHDPKKQIVKNRIFPDNFLPGMKTDVASKAVIANPMKVMLLIAF